MEARIDENTDGFTGASQYNSYGNISINTDFVFMVVFEHFLC
jgi:hypothetical protein